MNSVLGHDPALKGSTWLRRKWANEMNFGLNYAQDAGLTLGLLTWSPVHCQCAMTDPQRTGMLLKKIPIHHSPLCTYLSNFFFRKWITGETIIPCMQFQ